MRKQVAGFRYVLVLAALVGVLLLSWLVGHTLRYSIPGLWHPPLPETDPQRRNGMQFDFEGIRRMVVFPGDRGSGDLQVQAFFPDLPLALPASCQALTYYTSLPAKCLTADGRFARVGGMDPSFLLVLPNK